MTWSQKTFPDQTSVILLTGLRLRLICGQGTLRSLGYSFFFFLNKYSHRLVNDSLMDWKSNVKTNPSFTNKNIFILGIFTLGVNISMKSSGLFNKVLTKNKGLSPLLFWSMFRYPVPAKQSLTHLINVIWHWKCH